MGQVQVQPLESIPQGTLKALRSRPKPTKRLRRTRCSRIKRSAIESIQLTEPCREKGRRLMRHWGCSFLWRGGRLKLCGRRLHLHVLIAIAIRSSAWSFTP